MCVSHCCYWQIPLLLLVLLSKGLVIVLTASSSFWALVEWLSIFVLLNPNSKKQVWKDIIVPDWRINISVGNRSLLCFDGESLNLARYQPDQVYSGLAFIPSFTWVLNVYRVEQLLRLKSRCLVLCLTSKSMTSLWSVWRLCYMFRCLRLFVQNEKKQKKEQVQNM